MSKEITTKTVYVPVDVFCNGAINIIDNCKILHVLKQDNMVVMSVDEFREVLSRAVGLDEGTIEQKVNTVLRLFNLDL